MFTIDDARTLLGVLSSLDARFILKTEEAEITRAQMWASTLADCEPRFAIEYVQRAYSGVRKNPVQPGEIRRAWINERDARARRFSRRRGAKVPAYLRDQIHRDIERGRQALVEREAEIARRREDERVSA